MGIFTLPFPCLLHRTHVPSPTDFHHIAHVTLSALRDVSGRCGYSNGWDIRELLKQSRHILVVVFLSFLHHFAVPDLFGYSFSRGAKKHPQKPGASSVEPSNQFGILRVRGLGRQLTWQWKSSFFNRRYIFKWLFLSCN